MDDGEAGHEIAQLETHIERLSESIEHCRKIDIGSKIAVAAGALWFVALLFWIVPFGPTGFVAALTALLGGIVLLGSNATTWAQTETELHKAEAARAELIGGIPLRVIGDDTPTLH